jgi:hypothetical protein
LFFLDWCQFIRHYCYREAQSAHSAWLTRIFVKIFSFEPCKKVKPVKLSR